MVLLMRDTWLIPAILLLAAGSAAGAAARCPDTPPFIADATINFDPGSTAIRGEDVREIRDIAARAGMRRASQICVYGTASRREDGAQAESMAMDRAEAVADELRQAGIPSFQIDVLPVSAGDSFLGAMSTGGRVDIVLEP